MPRALFASRRGLHWFASSVAPNRPSRRASCEIVASGIRRPVPRRRRKRSMNRLVLLSGRRRLGLFSVGLALLAAVWCGTIGAIAALCRTGGGSSLSPGTGSPDSSGSRTSPSHSSSQSGRIWEDCCGTKACRSETHRRSRPSAEVDEAGSPPLRGSWRPLLVGGRHGGGGHRARPSRAADASRSSSFRK